MTDTLGVHIDESGITAVRYDASEGDTAHVVWLGDADPAAPAAVAQGDGGAVLVGAAALAGDGPRVTDPLSRAGAGRVGALVAVLNHVVGRATTASGSAPARLAVVVPDDFDGTAREHVVAAGVAAGIADTIVVPVGVASAQPSNVDPVAAIAAGGARAGSLASAPFVTREDLGDTLEEPPPVVPSVEPSSGPASVFDADADAGADVPPEPARPASPPVAARPATSPTTAGSPPGPPPTGPAPVLRYEPPRRRVALGWWVAAVLIGLIAAVAGGIVLLSGDDGSGAETADAASTTVSTTTEVPSTTVATTTETPSTTGSTTTTEGVDSTTSTSSTTSSTTVPPSSTTTPVAVAQPGVVTLVETGLQFDSGTVVRFDQDAEVVIEEVVSVLGDSDADSGYEQNEFCDGSRTRLVRWGDLELVFTEEALDSEVGVFSQWHARGHDDPEGLVSRDGLGVGATVGFLEVTYGVALAIVESDDFGLFAVTNPGSGGVLNGVTTSLEPEGTVTDLWAGDSCTRVFN